MSETSVSQIGEVRRPVYTYVVLAPDGGYGWVITFASFICTFLIHGVSFSFGVLLTPIVNELGKSTASVSVIYSVQSGFYLMSGPFVSAFINYYGFRRVAIAGSIIGTIGIALSYFGESVMFLSISYGFFGGFGMIYLPSILIVSFYFEQWRALILCIAVCGSSVGSVIMPPVFEMCVQTIGWRHTLFIQAGMIFMCIIFASFFRPVKPSYVEVFSETQLIEIDYKKSNSPISPTKSTVDTKSPLVPVGESSVVVLFKSGRKQPSQTSVYTTNIPLDTLPSTTSTAGMLQPEDLVIRPLYRSDVFFEGSLAKMHDKVSTYGATIQEIEEEIDHTEFCCGIAQRKVLEKVFDFSVCKSPTFLLLALSGFFSTFGYYVPYAFLQVFW